MAVAQSRGRAPAVCTILVSYLLATVAAAAAPGTNAERMARGLPPKAPRKLYRKDPTPVSREYHVHLILSTRLAFSSFFRGSAHKSTC